MKKLTIILLIISVIGSLQAQEWEEYSSAALDFLLRNPKTANQLKPEQGLALQLIGDVLRKQGERKFELKYAEASADRVTVNTNDGRSAQIVHDATGKMYILVDGVIFPVDENIVNQATDQVLGGTSSIPEERLEYDTDELKEGWDRGKSKWEAYIIDVPPPGRFYSDICKEINELAKPTQVSAIYKYENEKSSNIEDDEILTDKKPFVGKIKAWFDMYENSKVLKPFTCIWFRDLDHDGTIGFNEIQHKDKEIEEGREFLLIIPVQTRDVDQLVVELIDYNTGRLVLGPWKYDLEFNNFTIFDITIRGDDLLPGTYLIDAYLKNSKEANSNTFKVYQSTNTGTQ